MSAPEVPTWNYGKVPFSVYFGGVTATELHLPLHSRCASIGEPALPAGETPTPPDRRIAGSLGYVVWSQPLSVQLPELTWRADDIVYIRNQFPRYNVDLRIGLPDILARLSAKTRSTLNRKLKRFREESGDQIDFRVYRTPSEMDDFFRHALVLSNKTYQQRLYGKGLPGTEKFLAAARKAAADHRARAYLLMLQNQPASYLYCAIQRGTVDYSFVGYDPAVADLSPGIVLQYHALADLCAEGRYNYFDFGMGLGQHKSMFATECTPCADIFVLDRCLQCVCLVLTLHSTNEASRRIGDLMERLGLKTRLRRLVRRI